MTKRKKLLNGLVTIVAVLAIGLVSNAMAKSITVTNYNETSQTWNGRDCISPSSGALGCKSFTLSTLPVVETLTEPTTGMATLSGYFVNQSSMPVQCSASYTVSSSSMNVGYIYVNQSSGTYNCQVSVH